MYFQNLTKQIKLLTFVLVVHICNTTTLESSQQIDLIGEENFQNFDKKNSRNNTDQIKSTPLPEVSKETMDIITIIWYLSTFLALAAFFFLMACSDRKCGRNSIRRSPNNNQMDNDHGQCPPTPSPSYSQFAPPSYESLVKENCHIYVVPIDLKMSGDKTNNSTITTTDCKIHTINELEKNSI